MRDETVTGDFTALVDDASEDELPHIDKCLADWKCESAPLNCEERDITLPDATAHLIIVFAHRERKDMLALREHLRSLP